MRINVRQTSSVSWYLEPSLVDRCKAWLTDRCRKVLAAAEQRYVCECGLYGAITTTTFYKFKSQKRHSLQPKTKPYESLSLKALGSRWTYLSLKLSAVHRPVVSTFQISAQNWQACLKIFWLNLELYVQHLDWENPLCAGCKRIQNRLLGLAPCKAHLAITVLLLCNMGRLSLKVALLLIPYRLALFQGPKTLLSWVSWGWSAMWARLRAYDVFLQQKDLGLQPFLGHQDTKTPSNRAPGRQAGTTYENISCVQQ